MDKIHHKTLEAMKRRETQTNESPQTETISPESIPQDTQVLVDKSTLDRQNSIIESLAARLANIEAESKAPKSANVSKSKAYEWPLSLSYYLFATNNKKVPIIEYISKRKIEEHGGMTFKNKYGIIENNQIVVLTLADGQTKEVDPLYLSEAEASEPAVPKFVIDKQGVQYSGSSEAIWAMDDMKRRNFLRQIDSFVFDSEYGEVRIPTKLLASTKTTYIEN